MLEWTSGTVAANGIEIRYELAGPEGGEPLLLLMGLACPLTYWPDALCSSLAGRGFRLLRFDHRDIGLSGSGNRHVRFNLQRDMLRARLRRPIEANYKLYDMAGDAIALLDILGIDRTHMVGLSMGGMIAQIVAATRPDRVRSLTTVMSSTNDPRLPMPRLGVLLKLAPPFGVKHDRASVVARTVSLFRAIGSPRYPTPRAELERMAGEAFDRAYRPAGILRQTHAIMATGSLEPLLANVRAPTQVIHGLEDPLIRVQGGRRTAELIRGARLEIIDGMGHDWPAQLLPRWSELIGANAARA